MDLRRVILRGVGSVAVLGLFVAGVLMYSGDDQYRDNDRQESKTVEVEVPVEPLVEPVYELDLTSDAVPSGVTFSRASPGWNIGSDGRLHETAADIPRLAYDGSGEVTGWLIEQARTNLVLHSGAVGLEPWQAQGGEPALLDGGTSAPDGTATATLIRAAAPECAMLAQTASAEEAGAPYVASIFLKSTSGTSGSVRLVVDFPGAGGGGLAEIAFDLEGSGLIATSEGEGAGIDNLGGGWVRAWVVARASNAGPVRIILQDICQDFEVRAWGAQLEKGIVPSGYIPTSEEPASRAADSVTVEDIPWFRSGAGTFTIEGMLPKGPARHSANIFLADDGSDGNAHRLYVDISGGVHASVITNGEYIADAVSIGGAGMPFKAGLSYSTEGFVFYSLGGSPQAVNLGAAGPPQGIKRLTIGQYSTGTLQMNGVIGRIRYFDRAYSVDRIAAVVG